MTATFDQIFRRTGQRKVGGGPKTTAADETTFVGDLGRGRVTAIVTVRCIDPMESFCTSSGMRLRDSKVGSGGHFLDVQIDGPISDEELIQIEAMVQAIDPRMAVARRKGTRLLRPSTRPAR